MLDFLIWACQLHAHSALQAPSPALLRHHCALISASQITVSTLAPIKWGVFLGEGQLIFLKFPKETSTRQKLIMLLVLVDLIRVDLFTFSTCTWAGLTAKLLLKDRALLCHVEELEAQAVSNILWVSQLCLFCVSKGVVSTAECRRSTWGKGGGVINRHRPFWKNAENTRKRGRESQFSEDPQTLLFSQLCLAAL